jgi:predicted DNA-binding transcriptional regulator AlpA
MAEPQAPDRREPAAGDDKLFTLSEISQRTGISMPTLQRYKKTYQGRIPSVGTGRKQRYPEHSLPVFAELRSENAGKRGRPRKNPAAVAAPARGRAKRATGSGVAGRRGAAAKPAVRPARRGRPPKAASAVRSAAGSRRAARGAGRPAAAGRRAAAGRAKTSGLLTLTEISKTTGISYPTLVRYVRLYGNRLPHEGKGRARRFHPEAVAEFRTLRQESVRGGRRGRGAARGSRPAPGTARRGRPPKAAETSSAGRLEGILMHRLRELEKFQQAVEKRFGDLIKGLQRLR